MLFRSTPPIWGYTPGKALIFPAFCRIASLILSIFASGCDSSVVLFMVCMALIYHISPSGILSVIIVIAAPTIFHVPISSGVSITLFSIGEFFDTLICISFCFIVFGLMVIVPELLTLPIVT